FPRLEQTTLRGRQAIVRRLLLGLQAGNGHTGFGLTAVDRLPLFFRLTALTRQLLDLLCLSPGFVGGLLQSCLVRDDGFFLFVMFGYERVNRRERLRRCRVESGRFLPPQ